MKKRILILGLITLLGTLARAQDSFEKIELSLSGAIEYAMDHNKELQNARQELVKTNKSIWETISQGLPQVDVSLDYMTYFNYELQFQFGGGDAEFTQEQINAATTDVLSRPEFAGLSVLDLRPHYAASAIENVLLSSLPPSTILMSDQMTAKLQVAQLIFSGQYIVGVQTARLGRIIAEQALDNNEVNTKQAVVNAYYLVLITESSVQMVEDNLKNLQTILRQTEKMFETGMAESIDVDQFQITVNQLENTRRAMARNLEITYNMLRFTLGLPAGSEIVLTDDLESLFDNNEAGNLLLYEFDKEENITYQILNSQADISKKLWEMEKWNYGPTLAGFYNYNAKILTTGFDMTPRHLAGFSVSLPIFSSGMRYARTTQARIDYEIAERNAEILGDQLSLQESQLKYDLQNSLDNYDTQKENVEVAKRVLDNYKLKYQHGMASSLDVTQANSSFLEAQGNYLNAMFEVMNAQIQLEKLTTNLNNL